ncbi:uncharacterized protein BDZ99DRAFT_459479 [Mytilinidion resinicola]|uniref:Uncharacterized protein n=1 Tax=Mytilinidion resinicola TaxID=574789 RepID=A0A6A6Z0L9_9PEZI|nr:uncharacterized protein BDZ99DRAFT_459479 [Mytilinidion resinicola]KAF2813705.1 hypothetical protein BDZ99DRAFT_459479 [Mytilinidion resinicola]
MAPCFLLIGIAWDQYETLVGADKAEEMIARVKVALARDEQQFKDVGLDYQYLDYAPGESMQRLEKVLAEKEWSGVCIGIGIRANRQFTPLFESLVNTVHEKSPHTKLLFNTQPDDTIEAAKRWFPEANNGNK